MSIELLKKEIKNKSIRNLYLFYGPEEYLINHYVDSIKKVLLKDEFVQINTKKFEGPFDLFDFIDACESMPLFSERKVIIVKNSGLFKKGKKTDESQQEIKEKRNVAKNDVNVFEYLQKLPNYVCVIFIEQEIDKRLKVFDVVKNNGLIMEFTYQSHSDLMNGIIKKINLEGKTINEITASKIIDKSEKGMMGISNEIEKLILYCSDKKHITSEDVDVICTQTIKETVFSLTDALAENKTTKAFQILEKIVEMKESLPQVLFMIGRHFRHILQAKLYKEKNISGKALFSKMDIKTLYELSKVEKHSQLFDKNELKRMIKEIQDADVAIKTGKKDARLAIEMLISKFSK